MRSTDGGAVWEENKSFPDIRFFMFELEEGIILRGNNGNSIWRSTDFGLTWRSIATSFFCKNACYLGNKVVIASSGSGEIYRSGDSGLTWVHIFNTDISGADPLPCCYLGNGIVLFYMKNNQYRSTDYGLTWSHEVITDLIYTLTYAGNGVVLRGSYGYQCKRSLDWGITWSNISIPSLGGCLFMKFIGNQTLLAIFRIRPSTNELWRSVDNGATWNKIEILEDDSGSNYSLL